MSHEFGGLSGASGFVMAVGLEREIYMASLTVRKYKAGENECWNARLGGFMHALFYWSILVFPCNKARPDSAFWF